MNLQDLISEAQTTRRSLDREAGEARAVATRGKEVVTELTQQRELKEVIEQAVGMLTSIGETRQNEAQERVEALVTHGLRTVFEENLSFHVVQSVKANRPTVDFVVRTLLTDGTTVDTPVMDARGGGLAAVVGFMLRLVVMLLSPEKQRPVLFLDETFAHLSAEYEPRMAEFLRELCDRTSVQIIMVTHSTQYDDVADKVYRFSLNDGATVVSER